MIFVQYSVSQLNAYQYHQARPVLDFELRADAY